MEELWDSINLGNNTPSDTSISKKKDNGTEKSLDMSTSIIQPKEMYKRKDFDNRFVYDPNILIISQSLLKQLANQWEDLHPCPRRIFHVYIKKDYSMKPTNSMLNGSFFETLALGSGRQGHQTLEIPKGKKGQMLADEIKIRHQVSRFQQEMRNKEIEIIPNYNTQIKIYKHYFKNVFLSGELDMFPFVHDHGLFAYDLKLTGNVNSTFGDYAWGDPSRMDHLQGQVYLNLVRDIDFELNDKMNPGNHLRELIKDVKPLLDKGMARFVYLLFGYKCANEEEALYEQYNDKIEVEIDDHKQQILKERIDAGVATLKHMKDNGWDAIVNPQECRSCPLNELNNGFCKEGGDTYKY